MLMFGGAVGLAIVTAGCWAGAKVMVAGAQATFSAEKKTISLYIIGQKLD